jgi:hypothetical protein
MKAIFNKQMIGPAVFFFAGLLFFTIGSGLTYRQRTLEKQGIEVPGVVVDLQENYDSDGSTYTPVVQFKTKSGQSVTFTSSYSSNPPSYDVGETVTVVYPLDAPENAIVKGDGQMLHIIFMILGGIVAAIGFYLLFSTFRNTMMLGPGE